MNALSDLDIEKQMITSIKDIKHLFRLRKEIDKNATKDIRNLSRLKKENETTKDKTIIGM